MQVERYLGRISGPLLDRIDIHLEVPAVSFQELKNGQPGTSSATMREKVILARDRQQHRFQDQPDLDNGKMSPPQIRKFCQPNSEAESLLKEAMEGMGLSARPHDKILRVSRTITELDDRAEITAPHLSEAIHYRTLDRTYWT